ncbi:MAG: hypothetical protein KAW03_02600, partial [Candidatus Lokiarchaeota archaeon]|nr:hypothetical protein [Candidatus Lokiarchaeota archaeon]
VGFGPDKILDMIFAWLLFISFGILWYKIDTNKNLLRRVLYSINLFIIYVSLLFLTFWGQVLWVPITLLIILIYAIIALITNFIIKKPLKIRKLSLWTVFLLMTFIMMVLQVSVLQPNEAWITFIPIGIILTLAVVGTILDYMNSK